MQLSLQTLQAGLTVSQVLNSELPVFQKIMKLERAELMAYISKTTVVFIKNNFPGTKDPVSVAGEFAEDLMEQRLDWRLPDINLFFKFIKQNVGTMDDIKTFGNVMTPIRLLELATMYEEERCKIREAERKKRPELERTNFMAVGQNEVSGLVKSIMEKINQKQTAYPIVRISQTMEQHEQFIIDNVPNLTEQERYAIALNLRKEYYTKTEDGQVKKILCYPKAIEALENIV